MFSTLGIKQESSAPPPPALVQSVEIPAETENVNFEQDKIDALAQKATAEQKQLETKKLKTDDLMDMLSTRRGAEKQLKDEFREGKLQAKDYYDTIKEIAEEKKVIKTQLKELE